MIAPAGVRHTRGHHSRRDRSDRIDYSRRLSFADRSGGNSIGFSSSQLIGATRPACRLCTCVRRNRQGARESRARQGASGLVHRSSITCCCHFRTHSMSLSFWMSNVGYGRPSPSQEHYSLSLQQS